MRTRNRERSDGVKKKTYKKRKKSKGLAAGVKEKGREKKKRGGETS